MKVNFLICDLDKSIDLSSFCIGKKPKIITNLKFYVSAKKYFLDNKEAFHSFIGLSFLDQKIEEKDDDSISIISLTDEKKYYAKALMYWVKEECKVNPYDDGFVIVTDSETLNQIIVELTNYENYEGNYLYDFKHNSLSQLAISKTKEVKIEYLNLFKEEV